MPHSSLTQAFFFTVLFTLWLNIDSETELNVERIAVSKQNGMHVFNTGKMLIIFCLSSRWFAIMEIQMLVILFLYKYECHLLDPLPKEVTFAC